MYEMCWNNVTRAEDAIWKVFAAYTALFAGLSIAENIIGSLGFILLVITFSISGMCVALNANLWFTRNMALISNIEKEFLEKSDWDNIMPKKWATKKASFLSKEIWWIVFLIFPTVILATTFVIFQNLKGQEPHIVITAMIIGFAIGFAYFLKTRKTYCGFIKDMPGKQM
jgi:hypothetical protein